VTETIEYEQFEQNGDGSSAAADSAAGTDLSRLSDIPMELSVEIGRTHMTVGETLELRVGSVVTLERLAGETADLLVNGSAIARGEVVVIDEQYGLRITEILDAESEHGLEQPLTSMDADGRNGAGAEAEPPPVGAAPAAATPAGADADASSAEAA
jgi:flagellar motor switch protein FliN/FliY